MNDKRPFQMVSHIHYNLNANEDFVVFFTSKFIECLIDIHLHAFGFISGLNSQSITYLLREVDIYIKFWALKVKRTHYEICMTSSPSHLVMWIKNESPPSTCLLSMWVILASSNVVN